MRSPKSAFLIIMSLACLGRPAHLHASNPYGNWIIETWVGNGSTTAVNGAGRLSTGLNVPRNLALDSAGNIYYSDAGNQTVRRVDAVTGIVTTIAGTGGCGNWGAGPIAALSATLCNPEGVIVDSTHNLLYISERAQ